MLDAILGHCKPLPQTWINPRDPPKAIKLSRRRCNVCGTETWLCKITSTSPPCQPDILDETPLQHYQAAPSNARHPSRHCKDKLTSCQQMTIKQTSSNLSRTLIRSPPLPRALWGAHLLLQDPNHRFHIPRALSLIPLSFSDLDVAL